MMIEYDQEADAMYVTLEYREHHAYSKSIDEFRVLHFDTDDRVVGVEFLFISRGINLDAIPDAERIALTIRWFRDVSAPVALGAAAAP